MNSLLKTWSLIGICLLIIACDSESPDPPPPPTLPTISMSPLTIVEGSQNKNIFVGLRLSKAAQTDISVNLSTEDLSATAGEDYQPLNQSEIIIEAGKSRADCRITLLGDEIGEQDEEFILKINNVDGATIGTEQVIIIIENDDTTFDVEIPNTGYSTPSSYNGMTLLWSDEFDGEELNQEDWSYEIGNGSSGWGNNELQFYKEENTSIVDGHLVIQARKENANGFAYTSSRLITRNKVAFKHGRIDIRAALPEGQGLWPALWMLGESFTSVGWPRCGEIDIMELVGHQPNAIHGTVHYADPQGNHRFQGESYYLNGGQRFSQAFHVFSLEWDEDYIRWYVDDQAYYTITPTTIGNDTAYPFNEPFFFIFNVAVGGNWPGSPDASTVFPQNMIVDYVRVFQDD